MMNGAVRVSRRYAWLVLAALILCGTIRPVLAETLAPVRLTAESAHHGLEGHLAFLRDRDGVLGIAQIAGRPDFAPVTPRQPGLATGTLWIRFTVQRPPTVPADWVLAFGEPDIDDVRVYLPTPDGGFSETALGRRIPNSALPLAARRHVALLTLPESVPVTIHIRLSSLHKIRFEEAALWQPSALLFEESRQTAVETIQFGAMAVVVLVYALCGWWLRDATMMVYAVFVATTLARHLTHTGVAALLFPDAGGQVNYLLGGGGLLAGIAAFIFLWDRVLDLKRVFPIMHSVYGVAAVAVLLPIPWVLTDKFALFVPAAQLTMLAASLCSVVLAAVLVRRNPRDVLLTFYLVAFLPIVLAWAVEIAAMVSPLVPVDLGRTMNRFATMAHLAILSGALAYRFGLLLRQREEMNRLATIDSLTGIANRRHFIDVGTEELVRRRPGMTTAVLVLDIDRFKRINDTWGHAAGDHVIQSVAHLMARIFRQQDTIGRLGGEEFAALLPETDLPAALDLAERLREAAQALVCASDCGQDMRVTVSIGVAMMDDGDASIHDVLKRADRALYRAKAEGRNLVVVERGEPLPV